MWCYGTYDFSIDSINLNSWVTPIVKFRIFKISFWKWIIVLAFAKTQHVKKNDESSNRSTLHILKNRKFQGIFFLLSWTRMKFLFHWYIYINCWSLERKRNMLRIVMTSVIFMNVSLNIFNKNEPNSILTNFHDFIINLRYLGFICTKYPHYYETRLSTY